MGRPLLLVAFAGGVLALEWRRRARRRVEPWRVHTARNLVFAGIAAATVRLVETPLVLPAASFVDRHGWGLTGVLGGSAWLRALVALALMDYTLYVWHIATHRVPLLWRFHLVHHIDRDLDATTALRFHAGELALSVPWRLAQIIVIGVSPDVLVGWQTLTLASILFHHSNTRLSPRMERVLQHVVVTPQMHAIHHSVDTAQRDSNFSSGLALWDRAHHTFRVDAAADVVVIGVSGHDTSDATTLPRALLLPLAPDPPASDRSARSY
jgi:sterol desaturase/sphingolipid hydroxylase (fatty acid hydroxylase superfamily)